VKLENLFEINRLIEFAILGTVLTTTPTPMEVLTTITEMGARTTLPLAAQDLALARARDRSSRFIPAVSGI
jgi:hypothetical protein